MKPKITKHQVNLARMNDPHIEMPKSPDPEKSKGLGDTIKKVTNKLGIKQCGGCKKRQEKLNRLFPYKKESKKEG